MAELDIQGILAELAREEVDFLVIGRVAVGHTATFGQPRASTWFLPQTQRTEDLADLKRLGEARGNSK